MKKPFLIAALLAVIIVASSAAGRRTPNIKVGQTVPELVISDSSHCLNLQSLRGSYVLLSFWSSSDASSRVAVNEYDTAIRNLNAIAGRNDISHVSINFDDSAGLFAAIVRADGLDAGAQFNARNSYAGSIIADFNLRDGFGSLLIDPDGKIIAINPDVSNLTAI